MTETDDSTSVKVTNFKKCIVGIEHMRNQSSAFVVDCFVNALTSSNLLKIIIRGSTSGFRLNDGHVIGLTESIIKANIQLLELSLTYHHITDVGFEEIGRLFQPGVFDHLVNNLEGLDLEGNCITGSSFTSSNLSSAFDCPLVYLNLSCNPFSKAGSMALAEVVSKNKILRQLSLSSCNFDLASLVAFLTCLLNNSSLHLLYIDRPLLKDAGTDEIFADHFSRVLSTAGCSLSDLSFRYAGIGNGSARLLSTAFSLNPNLVSINLESNQIGDAGAEALASYLLVRKDNSIKSLGLSFNLIGDDGANALAEALKLNTSLRHLSLKRNKIGWQGLSSICEVLEVNSTLESVTLFGNKFNNVNGKQFYNLINYRIAYTGLFLDIEVYVVDGDYCIAENC